MSGEPTGGPGCHGDRTTGLFPPVIWGGNGVLQESGKISQKHKVKTSAGKTKVGPLLSADSKLTWKEDVSCWYENQNSFTFWG